MEKKQQSFEDRLTELEELVRKMEGGSLPLSEALAAYEAGMKLSKQLTEELSGGELIPMEDAP